MIALQIPDLGREFTPHSKFISRSKKEAEHLASLLVLQYLKGNSELCGTVKEIDGVDTSCTGGSSHLLHLCCCCWFSLLRSSPHYHSNHRHVGG